MWTLAGVGRHSEPRQRPHSPRRSAVPGVEVARGRRRRARAPVVAGPTRATVDRPSDHDRDQPRLRARRPRGGAQRGPSRRMRSGAGAQCRGRDPRVPRVGRLQPNRRRCGRVGRPQRARSALHGSSTCAACPVATPWSGSATRPRPSTDPGAWLRSVATGSGLAALEDAGLVCELMMRPAQLDDAADVVAAYPGLTFVLDHAGKPPIASGWSSTAAREWASLIARSRRRPNLVCKLSGLTTMAALPGWSVDDLRPFADLVLDCFGAGPGHLRVRLAGQPPRRALRPHGRHGPDLAGKPVRARARSGDGR